MRTSTVRGLKAMAYGTILTLVVQFIGASEAQAQFLTSPTIFDVRRSLPLDPDEVVTHDFYINAGPEVGLKKGSYINVVRPLPVHDPIQNKQQATLNVPIGKLQIIHVEKNIAVGRLQSELGDDERPTVEFEAVMIGDRVDLGSITSEAPQKKRARLPSKTTAQAPAPVEATVRVVEPSAEQAPAVVPVQSVPPTTPTKVPAPPASPTSAEGNDSPGPLLVKKPFPVAFAPDMLRLDQLESDFY